MSKVKSISIQVKREFVVRPLNRIVPPSPLAIEIRRSLAVIKTANTMTTRGLMEVMAEIIYLILILSELIRQLQELIDLILPKHTTWIKEEKPRLMLSSKR